MRIRIADNLELEVEEYGAGDPVVFIHGALLIDVFAPLLRQPEFSSGYRVINYRRRSFAGSTHTHAAATIADHALDCRLLLDALGIEQAHIVGHSYGASIAFQFARDYPDRAATVTIEEMSLLTPAMRKLFTGSLAAQRLFAAGETVPAIDRFLDLVNGPGSRAIIERALPPGTFDQAILDADTFFRF